MWQIEKYRVTKLKSEKLRDSLKKILPVLQILSLETIMQNPTKITLYYLPSASIEISLFSPLINKVS